MEIAAGLRWMRAEDGGGSRETRIAQVAMTRLLLLAAKRPELVQKGTGIATMSGADAELIRETVRKSLVNRIYQSIFDLEASHEAKGV